MDLPILLARPSEIPLQRQIYLEIRKAILAGQLRPRVRVPSTRALAEALEVSRTTTALAYEQLMGEGYLTASSGSGTYVCAQLPDLCLEAGQPSAGGSHAGTRLRLSEYGRRLAESPRLAAPPCEAPYDFSLGCPSLEEFPMAIWMRLLARHARRAESAVLDYAPDPQGHPPLRAAIAAYLGRSRAVKCDAGQVVVVSGTQQAINMCLQVLVEPGGTVAMEDPGYFAARRAFQAYGARILPLPVGAGGLDLDPLDGPEGAACRMVYVTPSHQFPTGTVMDPTRRLRLLAFCRGRGAAVFEDDYDSEFRFRGRPLPAMQGLDEAGVVLYAGTFSKILFPAFHMGYLVVPQSLAETFTKAQWVTSREPSSLQQWALADFILEGHLERHIRRIRALYAGRRDALVENLQHYFGTRVEILGDEGGMHLTARFETRMPDSEVLRKAAAVGIILPALADRCMVPGRPHGFVFGFARMSPARIREGVRRLAELGL
jgi:GntR family transcriptional regulator / MocR family aminotransferase